MTTITYQRKTKQFGEAELLLLQNLPAGQLAIALTASPAAVIALRGVAEVMLNEDQEKLELLLADPILTLRWQHFEDSSGVDDRDRGYAKQLEEKLATMINK